MARGAKRGQIEAFRAVTAHALTAAGVAVGDPVAVACSHGPDSLALADAILGLRRKMRLGAVTLFYVDHHLREASRSEGARVLAFAKAAGAAAHILHVTVDPKRGGGLEEAARVVRYAALEAAADEAGVRWIALGHTASDQAETLLHRLVRGAGILGAAAIPAVRGRYVRPLLALSRAEVEPYLAARGLEPSRDESNQDLRLTRNRLRHQVLPLLRALNPCVDESLARAAAALRESADVLDWAVARARPEVVRSATAGEVVLESGALSALPSALGKRLLSIIAADLGAALEARHLEVLWALAGRPSGRRIQRELASLTARREGGTLVLARRASKQTSRRPNVALTGGSSPAIHEKSGEFQRARQ